MTNGWHTHIVLNILLSAALQDARRDIVTSSLTGVCHYAIDSSSLKGVRHYAIDSSSTVMLKLFGPRATFHSEAAFRGRKSVLKQYGTNFA